MRGSAKKVNISHTEASSAICIILAYLIVMLPVFNKWETVRCRFASASIYLSPYPNFLHILLFTAALTRYLSVGKQEDLSIDWFTSFVKPFCFSRTFVMLRTHWMFFLHIYDTAVSSKTKSWKNINLNPTEKDGRQLVKIDNLQSNLLLSVMICHSTTVTRHQSLLNKIREARRCFTFCYSRNGKTHSAVDLPFVAKLWNELVFGSLFLALSPVTESQCQLKELILKPIEHKFAFISARIPFSQCD